MIMIYLDFVGNNIWQNRREAVLIIEEAAALGKSPISPDGYLSKCRLLIGALETF